MADLCHRLFFLPVLHRPVELTHSSSQWMSRNSTLQPFVEGELKSQVCANCRRSWQGVGFGKC